MLSCAVVSDSLWPDGQRRRLCPWWFSRQEYWSGLPCPPPRHLSNPRIRHRSPALWANSLPSEPPGKHKNTGMGSLSFLQGIFPTQESNQGLLHCRWITYQLSHQGSPYYMCISHLKHLFILPVLEPLSPFVYCEQDCCEYGVHISFWIPAFKSFEYISRSEIARSCGNSIFNLLQNCHATCYRGCTILHFH